MITRYFRAGLVALLLAFGGHALAIDTEAAFDDLYRAAAVRQHRQHFPGVDLIGLRYADQDFDLHVVARLAQRRGDGGGGACPKAWLALWRKKGLSGKRRSCAVACAVLVFTHWR